MKLSKSALFSFIGIFTICTTPIFTDAAAKQEENTPASYASECELPEAFMNIENMANAVADPTQFMQLVELMSKPETMQTMMNCSTDTVQWSKWSKNLMDPSFKMNAAMVFMNPQVYMNWMTAMMNPQMYQTSMATFMNPSLYMQWMTAMSNPTYYQGMYKMMDTTWQQNASTWMLDQTHFQAAVNSGK